MEINYYKIDEEEFDKSSKTMMLVTSIVIFVILLLIWTAILGIMGLKFSKLKKFKLKSLTTGLNRNKPLYSILFYLNFFQGRLLLGILFIVSD